MNWQADLLEGTVDFAFANSGGIRADILAPDITRGEVIEAFQNVLATTTLTGAQVKEVLEQGASGQYGMVQVSGLSSPMTRAGPSAAALPPLPCRPPASR